MTRSAPPQVQLRRLSENLDYLRIPLNAEQRAGRAGEVPYWGANSIVDYLDHALVDEPVILVGEDGAPFFEPFRDVAFAVEGPIWPNNHIHVLRPRPGVDHRYVAYALNSVDYSLYVRGSTRDKLNQSALASIELPAWYPGQQRDIADYLDHETAEIDAFITDLQHMTTLSQEEWRARRDAALSIGQGEQRTTTVTSTWFSERVAHWQEGPLKFLFDISLGKMLDEGRHVAGDAQYPYVRAGDIGDGRLNLENLNRMPFNPREQRRFAIDSGDLLVVEGGSVGTNVVLNRPLDGIYFQKTVNRMRSKAGAVPQFYSEVLNSYRESGVLDTICNRSTIMHLTADKLGSLVVPVPPVGEQRSIATYLQAMRSRVEELEDECKRAIDLAVERRAALISAALTGRIDVSQRHKPIAELLEEEVLDKV